MCCGDGVLAFGETCEDGNADPTDAARRSACRPSLSWVDPFRDLV
ncbi:hypothetical protein [Polyangium mundeleinium]